MAEGRGLFIARESALISVDGQDVTIHQGRTIVREGHPLLAGREHMFMPLTVHYDVPEPETARPSVRTRAAGNG